MDNAKLDAAVRKFDALSGRFDAFCAGRRDDRSPEAREAAAEARRKGGGGANTTKSAAMEKIQGASHESLMHAFKHPNTDPKIKKMIERELDDRANVGRATPFGSK